MDKIRTFARPSRRQGATPDIPRPRYMQAELKEDARTFGMILDTSGSMSAKAMGMAPGSIASCAAVREVPYAGGGYSVPRTPMMRDIFLLKMWQDG